MKFNAATAKNFEAEGRSREGAWIEISTCFVPANIIAVAPARERGLKCCWSLRLYHIFVSRSREGAWIEIHASSSKINACLCRSREGAWIEIVHSLCVGYLLRQVAPARERGLKFNTTKGIESEVKVAPARERGLK